MVSNAKGPNRRRWSAVSRRPSRQDYTVAAALLLLLAMVASRALTDRHLDLFVVIALATVGLALPALWLAWATYRSGTLVSQLDVAQVADNLAVAVASQWRAEAAARHFNDPYPLPVSWVGANDSLTDTWDSQVKVLRSSTATVSSQGSGAWAVGSDQLAGQSGELAEVLAHMSGGRLVVLGEPGSGKTMLMVRAILDLLTHRVSGGPIPILVSMASWDPTAQDLRDWLTAQLIADHPALASVPPPHMRLPNQAAALLTMGLILPVLDGLDELPPPLRSMAIAQVNDKWPAREPIVLTSRIEEFRRAIRPSAGIEVVVRGAAVIQLCPLDIGDVGAYLRSLGSSASADPWGRFVTRLDAQAPVAHVLSNPQMLVLARIVYSPPLPGQESSGLPYPTELYNLPDETAIKRHLLDGFISSIYGPTPTVTYKHAPAISRRRPRAKAEHWFIFIARHLQNLGTSELAWWRLSEALYGKQRTLALLGGSIIGFLLFVVWLGLALARGLIARPAVGITLISIAIVSAVQALGVAIALWPRDFTPPKSPHLITRVRYLDHLTSFLYLKRPFREADLASTASPISALRKARGSAIFRALVCAYFAVIAFVVISLLGGRITWDFAIVMVSYSVVLSVITTAWGSYQLAHFFLAFRGKLPYLLFAFLADTQRRGVLSTTGASYQFRYSLLQETLADPARTPDIRQKIRELSDWALGNPEIQDAYITVGAVQSDIEYAVSSVATDSLQRRQSFRVDAAVRQTVLERIRLRLNELGRRSLFNKSLRARLAPGLGAVLDPAHIVLTDAMTEVERLAENVSSASIGISGVRGVGKSTLIRWVCEARHTSRRFPMMGLYVSAPVEYDARDFLIHLYTNLCQLVLSDSRIAHRRSDRKDVMKRHRMGIAAVAILVFGVAESFHVVLMRQLQRWGPSHAGFQKTVSYAAFIIAVLLAVSYFQHLRAGRSGIRIDDAARERLHHLKYQMVETTGHTGTFSGAFGFTVGRSRSRAFSENQMTLPELVADYRLFTERLVSSLQDLVSAGDSTAVIRARLIIGIDEIDRIENAEQAEKFLNDIKAIFGIPSCFYVASLSADALATFERRAISARTAFDTAFDTMIRIEPLDLKTAREILERRAIGLPYPFIALCHILSGGIPRELMRVARSVFDIRNSGHNVKRDEVDCSIIAREVVSRELNSIRQGLLQLAGQLTDPGSAGLIELLDDPLWPSGDLESDLIRLSTLVSAQEDLVDVHREVTAATDIYDRLAASTFLFLTVLEIFSTRLDNIVSDLMAYDSITQDSVGASSVLQLLVKAKSLLAVNPSLAISHVRKFRIDYHLQNVAPSPISRVISARRRAAQASPEGFPVSTNKETHAPSLDN
jgi:hypothetical protein